MAAVPKWAEPPRPAHAVRFPEAWWDESAGLWRDGDDWFDSKAAEAAVAFFPKHLRFTKGEWAGKPFVLAPWEADDIVRPLFGWKRADGTRRYRRCYIWVPRKNGKTELAAGLSALMLLGDGELGGEVYAIASEEAQARIVFNALASMVAYSPSLGDYLECFKPSIYCSRLNASFRPLSGRPQGKHGLNMSGMIALHHRFASFQ